MEEEVEFKITPWTFFWAGVLIITAALFIKGLWFGGLIWLGAALFVAAFILLISKGSDLLE